MVYGISGAIRDEELGKQSSDSVRTLGVGVVLGYRPRIAGYLDQCIGFFDNIFGVSILHH